MKANMEDATFFDNTVLFALQSPTSFLLLRSASDALLDALEANEQDMLERRVMTRMMVMATANKITRASHWHQNKSKLIIMCIGYEGSKSYAIC